MGRGVPCDRPAPEATCDAPNPAPTILLAGDEEEKLLDDVEQNIGQKKYRQWANTLEICQSRGLTDRRVREFLQKCLEKMVISALEETGAADMHIETMLLRASSLIGDALASDFSPWAAKCVVALIPERDSSIPCVFREVTEAQTASTSSQQGQHRTNDLLAQCAGSVSAKVKTALQGLELRAIIFTWCQETQVNALQAILRASNVHETKKLDMTGSTLKTLAQHVLTQLEEIGVDQVPVVLTEEGPNKQPSTDGLEGLDKMLQMASDEYAEKAQLLWRHLAIRCIQSSKLMLRRAGLEVFAKLAEIVPQKASEWLVAPDSGGKDRSVLDCLTGERAHEKLVDSLRNFVFMYSRHRMITHEETGDRLTPAATQILDSMVATCVGSAQHPTKDVRDAFRSALARLTVTLPYNSDSSFDKENIKSRVQVAFYLVNKLLVDLRSRTAGAADLALLIFSLPPPHNAYDPVSSCMPSPKYLVSACRISAPEVDTAAANLAHVTFELLFESFVYPMLERNYGQLLHALAVCLQASACMGRPGSEQKLKDAMLHFVTFYTGRLKIDTESMSVEDAAQHDAAPDVSPALEGKATCDVEQRSARTIIMRLLLDVTFFHLRSDSVAMPEKWQKSYNSADHPNRMDWAKEGKVPMLNMTRGAFLEACEREHDLGSLIVQDALKLEEEAKRDGREKDVEHEEELWLRLQDLRFLHVEQDDNRQSQKVSFEVMEQLWHKLPSELCCKWLRVLADSGEALSEEVTERAFKQLVCGVDLPLLGKHGFNCFEALFGEINSRQTERFPKGRMQISGRHVVHKGIKISGKNLVRRRVSWFCVNALRRNVGTITGFDDTLGREKEPFDFENDDLHDGRSKINQLVPLKELFDCHVVEDARSPQDLRAFEIEKVHQDLSRPFACDLIGMDELWRVALEALDDGVAARACELMLELSRHLPGKFVCDFLNRVFEELEASFPLTKKPPISPSKGTRRGRENGVHQEAHNLPFEAKLSTAAPAAQAAWPKLPGEKESKTRAKRGGAHGGKGLRFSRALGLLQCLLDAHVVQCSKDAPLPHRCCVHGKPLKLTLKLPFRARNKIQHIEPQIGILPVNTSFNHQQAPHGPIGVQSNQQHSQFRNGTPRSNRPPNCPLNNSPSSLGSASGFAAVSAQNGGQNEVTFQSAYCNLTCKKLLLVAKDVFVYLKDVPLHALDLKWESGVKEQALGKTLREAGCADGARITIVVRNDGGEARRHGFVNEISGGEASILHLMSDRVKDPDAADLVIYRHKYLLASLQELENQDHDEELSKPERAQLQKQLWLTLQSLPTADYIKRQVHSALCGKVPWESILGRCSGIWQAAYTLQVVESELQVTDLYDDLIEVLSDEKLSEIKREEAERRGRRNGFVLRGGARMVFELVAEVCRTGRAWCHPGRMSWRICTPLYLSMMRLILHHMSMIRMDDSQQMQAACDDFERSAEVAHTNGISTRTGTKSDIVMTLAGSARLTALNAAHPDGSASKLRVFDGVNKDPEEDDAQCLMDGENDYRSSSCCGEQAAELHSCLETVVRTMLEVVVTLSANSNADKIGGVVKTVSSAGAFGANSKRGTCVKGATIAQDDCIQNVIEDALSLIHMVINARGCLSLRHRNEIIHCIFKSSISGRGQESSSVVASVNSNVDALIRQLLMVYRDEQVRKQTLLTLFDAVSMGWDIQRSCEEQGKGRAEVAALDMRSIVKKLVEASLQCLVTVEDSPTDLSEGGSGPNAPPKNCDGADNVSSHLKGKEVFLWVERVLQLQKDKTFLLKTDDQLDLLHLILKLLAGQRDEPSFPSALSSKHSGPAKRKGSNAKKAMQGAVVSKVPAKRVKVSNGAAAGILGLADNLLARLSSSRWLPLVSKYGIANILFEEYLMATDPNNAPLLGWPDDKRGKEARRAGWKALWQIASNLDTSVAGGADYPDGVEDGNAREVRAAGNAMGEGARAGCLASLRDLVSRTHHFIENLPPPTTRTEQGPDEMLVFDPGHNGLRHGQTPLVGLKNRRNTCYINSMLQQLFMIPEFHDWLEGRQAVCIAAGSEPNKASCPAALVQADAKKAEDDQSAKNSTSAVPGDASLKQKESDEELSARLQELFGYLRHSKQRFFDPGEFIKACKCPNRQQPLLDKAHTQDDTMTFLETLMDALSNVHGTVCTDLFKVVEKDRRWVDRTNERRSITGREKEYLMLEIEDGIGDLDSALAKHFSEELMTGDNRVWNEKTQSKETVWKAPFIEESSLPEVLVVQLKRFKYNMTWDGRMEPHKLNTKVDFSDVLDLSDYVRRQKDDVNATASETGAHIYELQGLVVHSGQTIHSGHYYSFIKWHDAAESAQKAAPVHSQDKQQPSASGQSQKTGAAWATNGIWYKLDDDVVTQVSKDLLKEESFGGTVESKDQYGEIKRQVHSRSAYVLFYRKRRCADGSAGVVSASEVSPGLVSSALVAPKKSLADANDVAVGSSKRQRVARGEKRGPTSTRNAIDAKQAAKAKNEPDENRGEMGPSFEICCKKAVDLASLTAAKHSLAFDEDFMLWVQDLVSFAYNLTANILPMPARDITKLARDLQNRAQGDAQDESLLALTDASTMTHKKNKGALVQSGLNDSPAESGSSERDKANVERALAAGVQIPADLVAKICDMAVLSLVHVAARADTSSPRWRLLHTLVEKSKDLLGSFSAAEGCRLVLERACARCAAVGGDGEKKHLSCNKEDAEDLPKSACTWRSWIEMLLLKHPEDKVREAFLELLLAAAGSSDRGFQEYDGKPCGPMSSSVDPRANEGREGGSSSAGKRIASEALDSDKEYTPRNAFANSAGQRGGKANGVVEHLGVRLLEIADAALSNWSESTMCAALAFFQGGSRDKNQRQLHQYLYLISDLVSHGRVSSKLIRNLGEVVLKLAIQKAASHPCLTRVLAETWVKMLGPEEAKTNSPFRLLVKRVAFDRSDPLSLPRWTWLVEWLHRCYVDAASIRVTADPIPTFNAQYPAYFMLYLLRRELLHASDHIRNSKLGLRSYDTDICMACPRIFWSTNHDSRLEIRHRYLCLDVERAGYHQANGPYHYAGYLNTCERAVYTRPSGTSVFVIITTGPSNRRSASHPRRWLLAECKYGESWDKRGVSGGWHVLHDAAVLAEAIDSGDMARMRSANLQGLRQILYSGDLDEIPLASCSRSGEHAEPGPRACLWLPFSENALLETYNPPRNPAEPEDVTSPPTLCCINKLIQGGEMQLTALSKHDQNNQNYTLQFARVEQYEGHASYAWQLPHEPAGNTFHFREIQGEPPKTWTVWSCTSDASKSEGAASGPVDGAASGARAAGHDPVLIDSTPNTPPSNADADVPLAVGLNHSAAVEESRASAGAGAWEPGPTVNRPLLVPNFKLALQANMTKTHLGSERDRPIFVDDDKNDGKSNKAQHIAMLQMKIREIAQIDVTEEEAVRLLNKAAPTTLMGSQYQPSDIDNAVAAYFDQM